MRLFESQPEWLRDPAPAVAPSIPFAIPVPVVASSPGLLRRCVFAGLMMFAALAIGAFVSPYLPKPEAAPQPAPVVVSEAKPEANVRTSHTSSPVVQPVNAPAPVVVAPPPTPQAAPAAPTEPPLPPVPAPVVKAKPKAVVVEEPPAAPKPFYLDKNEAERAAKKEGKRVLFWIDGADEKPGAETIIKSLGERVVHCRLDSEGEDTDHFGPRLSWAGDDGRQWFARADKFAAHTPNTVRAKMGLPVVNAAGKEVAFPQVVPPQESRFRNFADRPGDGNCLWVATDTLLKTHGYNVSLSKNRWGGSDIPHAISALQQRGVKFAYRGHFTQKDRAFLQASCDEGFGCVVTITCGPNMGHAIDLVGIDDKRVAIIDNNDPELKTRTVSRSSFEATWDGGAIAILPKDYTGKLATRVMQCPGGQCPAPTIPGAGGGRFDVDAPESLNAPGNTGAFGAPIIRSTPKPEEAARQFFKEAGFSDAEIAQRLRSK